MMSAAYIRASAHAAKRRNHESINVNGDRDSDKYDQRNSGNQVAIMNNRLDRNVQGALQREE
jgi:hypothetical protein